MRPTALLLVSVQLLAVRAASLPRDFGSDALVDGRPRRSNASSVSFVGTNSTTRCKVYPADADWPSPSDWQDFNETLEGALIRYVPAAAPCHNGPFGSFDARRCAYVRSVFGNSSFHVEDPASVMVPWTTGESCPVDSAANCTDAGYPAYVVNATNTRQIQLAVNFARNNNIRLVIKNTGHDFNGKSTGGGALSIWTHHLKDFQYLPYYRNANYTGKAARVGAGLQAIDLFRQMETRNITLVAPGGATVGAYGGFMQGGGHSPVTPLLGLGADQVLSMEVVTADGRFVIVDRYTNRDLFWAMRGGGGGNYGVLVTATVKAYPAVPISSLSIAFTAGLESSRISTDVFWKGVGAYFKDIVRQSRVKTYGLFVLASPAATADIFSKRMVARDTIRNDTSLLQTFSMSLKLVVPNMTPTDLADYMSPLINELKDLGIAIPLTKDNLQYFPNYASYSMAYVDDHGLGDPAGNVRYASRLFPQANFASNTSLFDQTFNAIRAVVEAQYQIIGDAVAPTPQSGGFPDNAVLPAWRRAVLHATAMDFIPNNYTATSFNARHDRLNKLVQPWRDLTPGSGSYINEADIQEPDWQRSFYGDNYARLLAVKKKWDPRDVFYVSNGVGSDRWDQSAPGGIPAQNGKLCRTDDDHTGGWPPAFPPQSTPIPFTLPPNFTPIPFPPSWPPNFTPVPWPWPTGGPQGFPPGFPGAPFPPNFTPGVFPTGFPSGPWPPGFSPGVNAPGFSGFPFPSPWPGSFSFPAASFPTFTPGSFPTFSPGSFPTFTPAPFPTFSSGPFATFTPAPFPPAFSPGPFGPGFPPARSPSPTRTA